VTGVRVVIDAEVCVGIGQCEALEPEVFVYDEDEGRARVRDGATLPPERAEAAVRACPSGAISIVDESSGDGGDL
jgi:ferredoxin